MLKNDLDWTMLPTGSAGADPEVCCAAASIPDRRSRLRDIGEARIAIADYLAGRSEPSPSAAGNEIASRSRKIVAPVLSAIVLAAVASVAFWNARPPSQAEQWRRYVVAAPEISTQVEVRPVGCARRPMARTLVFVGVEKGISALYSPWPW